MYILFIFILYLFTFLRINYIHKVIKDCAIHVYKLIHTSVTATLHNYIIPWEYLLISYTL